MGRKIPGRKHRGVRDPEQQREKRLLKSKFNQAPSNTDDQPVPKSVLRIAELMKRTNNSEFTKKKALKKTKPMKSKKKLVIVHTKVGRDEKPVPTFEQRKGESDKAFLYRVNRICDDVKREAAFEEKFGVDVKRNPDTGKVEGMAKRQRDPLELIVKSVRREKKDKKLSKKKKKNSDGETLEGPRLTKSQKRQQKLKEKKKKRIISKVDAFDNFSDTVKFGEIVHAPPTLAAPKFVGKKIEAPRPGQRQLLLNSLMKTDGVDSKVRKPVGKSVSSVRGVSHKVIDKKGKRKNLPNAMRRQLEKQQKEIIETYKSIKSKKLKKQS